MNLNLFNSDGSIDQAKFVTAMRNLAFFSNIGMSASVTTNQQGGDNTTPTGMSSNGVTSATHNLPMGHNSTSANGASRTSDSTNDQASIGSGFAVNSRSPGTGREQAPCKPTTTLKRLVKTSEILMQIVEGDLTI